MNFSEITTAIELGLIFGLVAVGVYISFRILNFPDMTVDGSFALGAAISAVLIIGGYDPWLATICAILAGSVAGLVTACLNIYGRILHLLASILTMTALYSVNLRIMDAPNLGLLNEITIFQKIENCLLEISALDIGILDIGIIISHKTSVILLSFILLTAVVLGLYWFLSTQIGLAMRATGKNTQMATAQGINTHMMILLGIVLSNCLYALSGSILAQSQGFATVDMGQGMIIVGLAAVIIGEVFIRTRSILLALLASIFGAIIGRLVLTIALNSDILGLRPSDLKLVEAIIIATAMIIPHVRQSMKQVFTSKRQKVV